MELSCYGKALTLFVRGDTKLKMQKDTVEVEHLYLNKKYERCHLENPSIFRCKLLLKFISQGFEHLYQRQCGNKLP